MKVTNETFQIPKGKGEKRIRGLVDFAEKIIGIQEQIGFKISARGWCYQLETFGFITKAQFDKVESLINQCRQYGILSIDFVAEEEARGFSGVEIPTDCSPAEYMARYLEAALKSEWYYTPDWFKGEEYYIQMIVEKIDLKTLFSPVCEEYHIPIATSKGWSSMLQRAEYARRFREAEDKGLKCVLLYCGDHDPDGLRISDFLRSNLYDLAMIRWSDGIKGYSPDKLIIDRFGLNYDFIEENHLSWIENLITGSGKNLADPRHPNYNMEYLQRYLQDIGERKCEANALVVIPEAAQKLCRDAIEEYLGEGALERFREKRQEIVDEVTEFREKTGLEEPINKALEMIREGKENEES